MSSINFHKRVKIFPGVHLNIAKSGISASMKLGPVTINPVKGTTTITPIKGMTIRVPKKKKKK